MLWNTEDTHQANRSLLSWSYPEEILAQQVSRVNNCMSAKGRNTWGGCSQELCDLFLPACRNVNFRMETYGPLRKSPVPNCKICLWSFWVWAVAGLLKSLLLQVYHLYFAFMACVSLFGVFLTSCCSLSSFCLLWLGWEGILKII